MLNHTDILVWRGLFLAALLTTIFVGAFLVRLLRWFRARPTATNASSERKKRLAATFRHTLEHRRISA